MSMNIDDLINAVDRKIKSDPFVPQTLTLNYEEWNIILTALKISKHLPTLYKCIEGEIHELEQINELNCSNKYGFLGAYRDCKNTIQELVKYSLPEEDFERDELL